MAQSRWRTPTRSEIHLAQKIYVGNLPFDSSEGAVERLFAEYGTVLSVALPTDRETGRARGFGFVEMESADASKAITSLNGTDFGGRQLNVNEAKPRESGGGRGGYSGGGYSGSGRNYR
jgi:cold-inducible RNA-binding protein